MGMQMLFPLVTTECESPAGLLNPVDVKLIYHSQELQEE